MPNHSTELPKAGFALEVDGRLKTEFVTKEGAEKGAVELKRRFAAKRFRSLHRANTNPKAGRASETSLDY